MRAPRSRVWAHAAWPAAVVCSLGARAADVRAFNPDTPGRGYTPYTVAQGYFQLESDTIHVTESGDTQLIEALDPVFKYGLTDSVEIDVQTNGLLNQQTRTSHGTVSMTGFGDTIPALKYNVFGNDEQGFSAAVRFGVKLPTASPGLGNGTVEYNLVAPAQVSLPYELSMQVQEEIDLLRNQTDRGKHFSYGETASIGRGFGAVTLSAELFAQSGTDPNSHALYTADLDASYALSPVAVIAFGTYFGLNRFSPSVEAYTSFGFRF